MSATTPAAQPDELAAMLVAAGEQLDPDVIARAVRELDEDALAQLLSGAAGTAAVAEIFRRFPDYLDAARTGGVHARVGFDIATGGAPDRWAVQIDDGHAIVEHPPTAPTEVTLETSVADFLRLITASESAALLVLSGRLRLSGDAPLALALAGWFRAPGADTPEGRHLDPVGVDPVAVARLVSTLSEHELRERLVGVQDLLLPEIFRRFPEFVRADRIQDLDASVGWRISRPDGEAERWVVHLQHGECRVQRNPTERPQVTILCDALEFLRLVTGNGNPTISFLRGRVRIKGDLALAASLMRYFHIPSTRSAEAG
jgi:putative sterol carrier protein